MIRVQLKRRGWEKTGTRRRVQDASARAMHSVGLIWRQRYLPMHFGTGASDRYSYSPRKRTYNRIKFNKFGHSRPLEYSGKGREDALAGIRNVEVKARTAKPKIIITLPRIFQIRNRHSRVNMRREITEVIPSEITHLEAMLVRWLDFHINNIR